MIQLTTNNSGFTFFLKEDSHNGAPSYYREKDKELYTPAFGVSYLIYKYKSLKRNFTSKTFTVEEGYLKGSYLFEYEDIFSHDRTMFFKTERKAIQFLIKRLKGFLKIFYKEKLERSGYELNLINENIALLEKHLTKYEGTSVSFIEEL